jgi:uncharacterized cofD-like protein
LLRETPRGLNIVAIGGGTGLSTVLAGLKTAVGAHPVAPAVNATDETWIENLSAIVTVSDDGGSSGRLRDELQMLPPGDIRNCMVALSEDSGLLARLFRYRFPGNGDLGGHSFGNLFLAALTAVTGDFTEAVRLSSEVLASKGRIYPATLNDVHLVAEFGDGTEVHGETRITAAHRPIRRLRLEPEKCLPLPEALTALRAADIITIGPGSLYTSILPNLLVSRVASIIGESSAVKIFICNLMTQPGETDGFTAHQHLETIREYAPAITFDYIVLNNRPITDEQATAYRAEDAHQVMLCDELLEEAFGKGTRIVRADLLDEGEKVRHSPEKLARVIVACYEATDSSSHARRVSTLPTALVAQEY